MERLDQLPPWVKKMLFNVSFAGDKENDSNNFFFAYKDLKRNLDWTQNECNRHVSWLIDRKYVVRYDHWRYKYMLTDKGMELMD